MAREERFRENHENYSEYFPVLNKVKRRQPKFSKSSATLVSTLTVAASVALVTALFLVCRVLSIEPTCIKLEVNSQGGGAPAGDLVLRAFPAEQERDNRMLHGSTSWESGQGNIRFLVSPAFAIRRIEGSRRGQGGPGRSCVSLGRGR